ncbi:DUF481 domain-containing protein [Ferrimonas senticii]|uniref:DUF481 domain-containing protein n=1 Tax=Ferrimonas senticii TaxID=394566 RepID=UPI0004025FCA|nr:DUF481 domain-containing protein [Ferrimonas senticii]
MRALLCSTLLVSAPALAIVPPNYSEPEEPFAAEVEFGMQYTSGNSDSNSFNSRVKMVYDGDNARHETGLRGYFASDDESTSAEQYQALYQLDYKLENDRYVFGRSELKWDRFGSYTDQHTFSSGYGWTQYETSSTELTLELGGGYRYNRANLEEGSDEEPSTSEGIFRAAAKFEHQLHEYTTFTADATVESGNVNTVADLKLAYRNHFWADLALKFGVDISYTDNVPDGTKNTDVISTVNLLYSF